MKAIIYKNKARSLRKSGHSLQEISAKFSISKSTASTWTKDVILSPIGENRVYRNALKHREKGHQILHALKIRRFEMAEKEAGDRLTLLKPDMMHALIALSMIYFCEGAKEYGRVVFTNSNPELAKAFVIMLEKVFSIDRNKIRVCIHLHDYHNQDKILEFWSGILQIPLAQFTKPYMKKSNHLYKNDGYKGCARISYYNAHLARVILSFAKKFIEKF